MEFRYLGFDQQNSRRVYRFERIAKGEPTTRLLISADMALFLQYNVGIQEGPALCAHKLAESPQEPLNGKHELTSDDLLAYANARAAAETRRAEIRSRSGRRKHFGQPGAA
jgi:hypothetical protein